MRTIEEILEGRTLNAEEYRIINLFWKKIRDIRARRDPGHAKNRYLVGFALSHRRLSQREIDLETLASLTGLARSSLQKTLQSMVRDKLILLEKDENDLRRILVRPTQNYTDLSLDIYEETRDLIINTASLLKATQG
jgi:DNA-binding MarR family transcriptional regulator